LPHVRDKKNWLLFAVLPGVLVAACAGSIFVGASPVPLCDMLHSPIIELRLARIVLAALAGAALSTAGAIFQAMLRNPLADPYVLGVSSGAGLGAAAAIVLGLGAFSAWTLPGMAFAGSLATILLVYALASTRGGVAPVQTLLLSGVIVSSVLSSMLMFLVYESSTEELHEVVWWLLGSLQVYDWRLLRVVAIIVAVAVAVAAIYSRDLNLLTLGEEPAAHLGLNVERTKRLFLLLASLMTGATVAACGLIGFVGLMVPHIMRSIIGPDHRRLTLGCALGGAAFLVLADTASRSISTSREIPIGVITAMLGGPFFLYLLKRKKTSHWS
jgi:iron complex transport system permease protein